ncbi:hypothetical protein L202_05776 [Cryptococcus amylolentus CBS 6039]|uniref:SET domain-containing protein n=2 Tax=Cryptococcus amylolentus TaxID=104669 RepID=A0A1E3HHE6_9TREE|nr:hypothetical protein L202_05776 [Cryptococcus amylolentus CBS 6039]ODN75767.1 hypothetical protein L202_05776 [Cryptococcus amylolentus CBS 6039]ODN96937.1 hypothetical protein I350_07912 [Cryptococcus amylolentus CBS 6273]
MASHSLFDVSGIYFRHLDEPTARSSSHSDSPKAGDEGEDIFQWDLVRSWTSIEPPSAVATGGANNSTGPARRSSAPSDLGRRGSGASSLVAGGLTRTRKIPKGEMEVRMTRAVSASELHTPPPRTTSSVSHFADVVVSVPHSLGRKGVGLEKAKVVDPQLSLQDSSTIMDQHQLGSEKKIEETSQNEESSVLEKESDPHPEAISRDSISSTMTPKQDPSANPTTQPTLPETPSHPSTFSPESSPDFRPSSPYLSPIYEHQPKPFSPFADPGHEEPQKMRDPHTPVRQRQRPVTPESESSASAAARAAAYPLGLQANVEAMTGAVSKLDLSDNKKPNKPRSPGPESTNTTLPDLSANPVPNQAPSQTPTTSPNNPVSPQTKLSKGQKKRQKKKKRQAKIADGMTGYWWRIDFVSATSDDETLFAARHIPRGRVFMWEFPVAITEPDFNRKKAEAIYQQRKDEPENKEVLDALPNMYPELGIYGAFLTNSLPLGNKGAQVVVAQVSALGRSCVPNARWMFDEATNWTYVIALRDIALGEPLTIRHPEGYNTSTYRKSSFANRGITCTCPLCLLTPSSSQIKLSDKNRNTYSTLNRTLLSSFPSAPLPTLLSMIQEILVLLAKEGLWEMLYARFLDGFAVCVAFSDEESAKEWGRAARDAECLVGWYGGEEFGDIDIWFEDPKRHPAWGKRGSSRGWGPGEQVLEVTLGDFVYEEWKHDIEEKPLGKYAYPPEEDD